MKYYLIAGEPSGDLHGSNLIKGLLKADPEARLRFWGGDLMAAAGGEANDWIDMAAALGCAAVLLRNFTGVLSLCRDTLDLISGRVENLKCGAAPTYMRLNGRWTILPGTALPIGLAEEDELGDAVPLQMNDGDIVVLLSDGVTDGTDDKWVRQLLIAHAGDSPKEIAAQLVNKAKGRGHDDDRTVMVMKIEKLE